VLVVGAARITKSSEFVVIRTLDTGRFLDHIDPQHGFTFSYYLEARLNGWQPLSWSSDGNYLSIQLIVDQLQLRVDRLNVNTGEVEIGTGHASFSPVVNASPNGAYILQLYAEALYAVGVYVAPSANPEDRHLVTEGFFPDVVAIWSPNSQFLAYIEREDRAYHLFVYDVQTWTAHRVAENVTPRVMPTWSAVDSTGQSQLAFIDGDSGHLLMIRHTDGTVTDVNLNTLLGDVVSVTHEIAWSPDGSMIALVATTVRTLASEVYLISPGEMPTARRMTYGGDFNWLVWRP
jgi:hypothetical protein